MDIYELHATIAPPDSVHDLRRWVEHDYGFKFHAIENFCRDGTVLTEHIVTYEQDYQDLPEAQTSLEYFVDAAKKARFTVTRTKIESTPWHPSVDQAELPALYLESRTKIRGISNDLVWERGFHVSHINDSPWTTITRRIQNLTRADFELDLQLQLTYLMNSGCLVGSTQVEYCLMDTNPSLDDQWLRT